MLIAASLEVGLLLAVLNSHDTRTRVLGSVLWAAYLYYSATWAALAALAKWLHDRNNPPGGPA